MPERQIKAEGAGGKRPLEGEGQPKLKRLKEDPLAGSSIGAPSAYVSRTAVTTMERQAAYYVANPDDVTVRQLETLLDAAHRWLERLHDDPPLAARVQALAYQLDALLPSLILDPVGEARPQAEAFAAATLGCPPPATLSAMVPDGEGLTGPAALLHEAVRHDAARAVAQFLRCRGFPQPLDELDVMEVSPLVDWELQYQLELGPLGPFLAEAALYPQNYFTIGDGVVMVTEHPAWVVRTKAPTMAASKMRSRLYELYRGGIRGFSDVDRAVFATVMDREQKGQFRCPVGVPAPLRPRLQAIPPEAANAQAYIDAVQEGMEWHGPLPNGPHEWLLSRLPAAIEASKAARDPVLHIFSAIWPALKMVLFLQVQFAAFTSTKKKPQLKEPVESGT